MTREEYFAAAGERGSVLRAVDELIRKAAPDLAVVTEVTKGMTAGMLAYGMQPYQTKSDKTPREWPVIALANQKNYMSLYICAVEDGEYIAEKHADELGKVNVGKSCIRFKKLKDLNQDALRDILGDINTRIAAGEKLFGL